MNRNIRRATFSDLNQILMLFQEFKPNQTFCADSLQTHWQNLVNQPHLHVFVCELSNELVSMATLSIIDNITHDCRPYAYIEHVMTAQKHRGQGHAQAVLKSVLDYAWQKKCHKVMLLSGQSLTEAHHLYQSVGFNGDIERGFIIRKCAEWLSTKPRRTKVLPSNTM